METKKKYSHMIESEYRYQDEYDTLDECLNAVKEDWKDEDEDTFAWDEEKGKLVPVVVIDEVSHPDMDAVRAKLKKEIQECLSEIMDSDEDSLPSDVSTAIEWAFDNTEDSLLNGFFFGLEDPEDFEIESDDKAWNALVDEVVKGGEVEKAIDALVASISLTVPSIGFPIYYFNAETEELKPYYDMPEHKFKEGDRVRIISNPRNQDSVGKVGTVKCVLTDANTKEGLYQVHLDGDEYPLYGFAEEYCLEAAE